MLLRCRGCALAPTGEPGDRTSEVQHTASAIRADPDQSPSNVRPAADQRRSGTAHSRIGSRHECAPSNE